MLKSESIFTPVSLDEFSEAVIAAAIAHLEHPEPRVRTLVVKCLGSLSQKHGAVIYDRLKDTVLPSIQKHYFRDLDGAGSQKPPLRSHPFVVKPVIGMAKPSAKSSFKTKSKTGRQAAATAAVDDTTGWKSLETSLNALQVIMAGIGGDFVAGGSLTEELLGLCMECVLHINRHVRAVAFEICTTLSEICPHSHAAGIADAIVKSLEVGLEDNWSQVRYAASVALRAFITKQDSALVEQFYPILIPRMCLNRYYIAQGVQIYSQVTWRQMVGEQGCVYVAKYMEHVVPYYVKVTDADNHACREAACQCIAELAAKVDKAAVSPYVDEMLRALLICFQDDSWPVRDCACVASGRFVQAFPEESVPKLDKLYELWFAHLSDNIWSVREDAAVAIGCVVKGRPEDALPRALSQITELLPMAHSQPELDPAAKAADASRFSNQQVLFMLATTCSCPPPVLYLAPPRLFQVFSCGSLAPKLRKGGCSDCEVDRPKEPWEFTDGALYLVSELSQIHPTEIEQFLPQIADLVMARTLCNFFHLKSRVFCRPFCGISTRPTRCSRPFGSCCRLLRRG